MTLAFEQTCVYLPAAGTRVLSPPDTGQTLTLVVSCITGFLGNCVTDDSSFTMYVYGRPGLCHAIFFPSAHPYEDVPP